VQNFEFEFVPSAVQVAGSIKTAATILKMESTKSTIQVALSVESTQDNVRLIFKLRQTKENIISIIFNQLPPKIAQYTFQYLSNPFPLFPYYPSSSSYHPTYSHLIPSIVILRKSKQILKVED
jgi:hypothetical protein